jgi:hypothetical protein
MICSFTSSYIISSIINYWITRITSVASISPITSFTSIFVLSFPPLATSAEERERVPELTGAFKN